MKKMGTGLKLMAFICLVVATSILGIMIYPEQKRDARLAGLVAHYNAIYKSAKRAQRDCRMAFGYTGCQDRKFRALQLVASLNASFVPKERMEIATIQDFVESFAYYFQQGAATEYFMQSRENFQALLQKSERIPNQRTLGGHSIHMALRASEENCNAILVAGIGPEEEAMIKLVDSSRRVTVVRSENIVESDVHLSLEYGLEEYEGVAAPRANRFYLNHDTISANLKSLELYHDLTKTEGIRFHVLSGFQLMQTLGTSKAIVRMDDVKRHWESMRSGKEYQVIHIEMAAFSNRDIYKHYVNNLVMLADSLGMNEQELITLHNFLDSGKFTVVEKSYPSVQRVLKELERVIEVVEQRKGRVSRIHAHGITEHYLCYRESRWGNGTNSLIGGIHTANTMCCGIKELDVEKSRVLRKRFDELPEEYRRDDPHIAVLHKGDWRCMVALNLICADVVTLTGLGDQISSAGLVYHPFL